MNTTSGEDTRHLAGGVLTSILKQISRLMCHMRFPTGVHRLNPRSVCFFQEVWEDSAVPRLCPLKRIFRVMPPSRISKEVATGTTL